MNWFFFPTWGPSGDTPVCSQDSASVRLANCLLEDKGVDYSMLHLKEQSCRGQMDQRTNMVTFSFNGSSCGTEVTVGDKSPAPVLFRISVWVLLQL